MYNTHTHRRYKDLRLIICQKENTASQSHCSSQLSPTPPDTLTMHFEGQGLRGVVWLGHVFVVGHTAVGPLVVPSCAGNRQH